MDSRETAFLNDQRIMELATYHETRGLMRRIMDPQILSERFVEFKGLLRRGSYTMKQLEDKVYKQFGVLGQPTGLSLDDMLEATAEMSRDFDKRERHGEEK
jgi:hypothetical protein